MWQTAYSTQLVSSDTSEAMKSPRIAMSLGLDYHRYSGDDRYPEAYEIPIPATGDHLVQVQPLLV